MAEGVLQSVSAFMRREKVLLMVVIALFLLRLPGGWIVTQQKPEFFLHNDGHEYLQMAQSFARGEGLMKTEPFWYEGPRDHPIPEPYRPLLLSVLGGLFLLPNPHSLFALFLMQSVLFSVLISMMKLMADRLFGHPAGWLALVVTTCHPLVTVWAFRFSTELLFSVTLLAFIWQWWRLDRWGSYVWLGLLTALANYARPTALLLVPVAVVILAWQLPWRRWGLVAVFGCAFLLGMTPQIVRNAVHFGSPKITTFYGGYAFWLGNNQANLKAYRSSNGADFLHWQNVAFSQSIEMAKAMPKELLDSPPDQDAWWFSQAFEEIRQMGLVAWADMLVRRAWHFFRPWPLYGGHPAKVFWPVTFYELFLFAIGIAGLVSQLRIDYRKVLPMAVVLACGASGHILVYVVMRYRVPFLDLSFILLGSSVLAGLLLRLRQKTGQLADQPPEPEPSDQSCTTPLQSG